MKTISEDLIHEHKSILIALSIIEKMVEKVQNDKDIKVKDIQEIIDFLKLFADKCHHGKEEDYLFPALEEAGVKNHDGPIGIMLAQHMQGREYIKQMLESIANNTLIEHEFVSAASSYVNLLRDHIEKEDTHLFPMGETLLSASKQEDLIKNFENLEKNVIGEGVHEELDATLERFKKKYLG